MLKYDCSFVKLNLFSFHCQRENTKCHSRSLHDGHFSCVGSLIFKTLSSLNSFYRRFSIPHRFLLIDFLRVIERDDTFRRKKRRKKKMFDEGGKSSYSFCHHLRNPSPQSSLSLVVKASEKGRKKRENSTSSDSQQKALKTVKKSEFNLKTGDENSGNIRFDFPFSTFFVCIRI